MYRFGSFPGPDRLALAAAQESDVLRMQSYQAHRTVIRGKWLLLTSPLRAWVLPIKFALKNLGRFFVVLCSIPLLLSALWILL